MEWREQIRRSSFFAICCMWGVLIMGPALWLLIGAMTEWGVSGQSSAAWVQAIGSIGAIIAALVISNHQHAVTAARAADDREQKERALSMRLAFFALELENVVSDVVPDAWDLGVGEVDLRTVFVFETMLTRINSGFDEDLNADRVGLLYEFRVAIAGLIFTLKSTNAINPGNRDESIATYKQIVRSLLDRCAEHSKSLHSQD